MLDKIVGIFIRFVKDMTFNRNLSSLDCMDWVMVFLMLALMLFVSFIAIVFTSLLAFKSPSALLLIVLVLVAIKVLIRYAIWKDNND